MKLASIQSGAGSRVAAVRDGKFIDLHSADPGLPATMRELLQLGPALVPRASAAAARGAELEPGSVRLLAPVPDPGKVICIGLNYKDHAKESGAEVPAEPVVFCKFPSAVTAHEQPIVLPRVSSSVDYEAELVVVMGRAGRNIAPSQAFDYIAGYAPGNDVSARDWQLHKPGKQWLLGKSFDTFAPFGPYLTTVDEVPDPGNLRIWFRLNGRVLQDSSTSELIFPIGRLVSYVSQVCTLAPGDLIFTGTPAGVGFARRPPILLQPGDVAEVEIERLGVLRNLVVAEQV
jgi:2-keto-4-pentenoate hydratase/2-oxohepta-3-ene-1,7-dioic acid hydratase in catechol pathway